MRPTELTPAPTAGPAAAPQQLPATGSPASLLVTIGALFTLAGIALVVRVRAAA